MSAADLEACIRGFEGERRRVEAQLAMLVNRVEVSGAFLSDRQSRGEREADSDATPVELVTNDEV